MLKPNAKPPRTRQRLKWKTLATKAGVDLVLWTLAAPLAFFLRLEDPLARYGWVMAAYTLLGVPLKAMLIYTFGLYRQSWRNASMRDLLTLLKAIGAGLALAMVVAFLFHSPLSIGEWLRFLPDGFVLPVPRSVPFLEALLSIVLLGGARVATRWFSERVFRPRGRASGPQKRVLIVGAGEAGTLLAREALRHPEAGLLPVGFLDDDAYKAHTRFMGIPVVGTIEDLPKAVRNLRVDEVLIALPSAAGEVIRHVVSLCREAGVSQRIMPALHEILSGEVTLSKMREVRLEDLLRRDPVRLEMAQISQILSGKRVLITGAGGSIGSEIVRQVMRFQPGQVIVVGRGENSLYQLRREIREKWDESLFQIYVADIRCEARLRQIFERTRPQIIFHAAAHKHVPLMEMNPEEAVLNNVFGTQRLVQYAQNSESVERFVNISTDKAVNPTSVMGATKRVAEYIIQTAAAQASEDQVFVSVRFGNVLGSRGSVVPLFMEQVRKGGPVTVTHPEMRRFFMLIPEAVQLVLQAAASGRNSATYVLDMGEPVKIVDLARDIIMLSGFTEEEIPIVFAGLRPGEKLYEELLTQEEQIAPGPHEKIWQVAGVPVDKVWLEEHLGVLREAAEKGDASAIHAMLRRMIPTYRSSSADTKPRGYDEVV